MSYVLVHGGGFAASCWDRLLPLTRTQAIAVDLPGRGKRPADLSTVTPIDFVTAVVDEIVCADLRDVTLVGHSLAGITIPSVLEQVPDRIRRLVFVSCVVPPTGKGVFDVVHLLAPDIGDLPELAQEIEGTEEGTLDEWIATKIFCNDMDPGLRRYTLDRLVPEAPGVLSAPVDLTGLRHPVPRTYVRLLRDTAIPVASQVQMISNIGGADVVDIDAGHMVMISEPEELARMLNAL